MKKQPNFGGTWGLTKKKKEPNLKCWHKINQDQVPKFAKQVEQIDLHVITQQQQN